MVYIFGAMSQFRRPRTVRTESPTQAAAEPALTALRITDNLLSVAIGGETLWHWMADGGVPCDGFQDGRALVITIQAIHSISDFIVYAKEMLEQPIFIAHHGVLVVVACILPSCSGCMWAVWSITIGEAGSATIAIDALWRSFGFPSRGRKRVVLFGSSRLVVLYFVYMGIQTMSTHTNVTVWMDGSEMFSMDFPLCKFTTVAGTMSMMTVNFVTWLRMYKAYKRNYADKPKNTGTIGPWTYDRERSATPVTASLLDTMGYATIVLGCVLLVFRQYVAKRSEIPAYYAWLVLLVSSAFVFERSKTMQAWHKAMASDELFDYSNTPNATASLSDEDGSEGNGEVVDEPASPKRRSSADNKTVTRRVTRSAAKAKS